MADELRISERPELRRPVLVAALRGWNDGGQGASLAAGYLARAWSAARFADVDPEGFFDFQATRPHVSLVEGLTRQIDWPDNAFFHARVPGTERDAVLLLGPLYHLVEITRGLATGPEAADIALSAAWLAVVSAALFVSRDADAATRADGLARAADALCVASVTARDCEARLAAIAGHGDQHDHRDREREANRRLEQRTALNGGSVVLREHRRRRFGVMPGAQRDAGQIQGEGFDALAHLGRQRVVRNARRESGKLAGDCTHGSLPERQCAAACSLIDTRQWMRSSSGG